MIALLYSREPFFPLVSDIIFKVSQIRTSQQANNNNNCPEMLLALLNVVSKDNMHKSEGSSASLKE